MSTVNVLALSSSRAGGGPYFQPVLEPLKELLGERTAKLAFVPFAAADNDYEAYLQKIQEACAELPYTFQLVLPETGRAVIESADAVLVGGGNTFKLLHDLYKSDLVSVIKERVKGGLPYVGWSAGANLTGLSIGTTNDMPIIQPPGFESFGFFPFQINPHYINQSQENHHGETRDQRLQEYLLVNPNRTIVALPEGCYLRLSGNRLRLAGKAILFSKENGEIQRREVRESEDLSFLIK